MSVNHAKNETRIAIGQELPLICKTISQARMVVYAAATWDFINLHYDADYVRERGFKAPFVDGQMLGAYLAQVVQNWAGPKSFLQKLSFRNRKMVFAGDVLTCGGTVTAVSKEGNVVQVQLDLWVQNQCGESILKPASAQVRIVGELD